MPRGSVRIEAVNSGGEREQILVAAGHFEAPGYGRIVRLDGRPYWKGL